MAKSCLEQAIGCGGQRWHKQDTAMCAAPDLPLLLPTTSQRKVKRGPLKDPARGGQERASETRLALMVSDAG